MSAAQSVMHGNHHRNFVNITQTNAVCSGSTFMVALPAGAGVMSIFGFAGATFVATALAGAFGLQGAKAVRAAFVAAQSSQTLILQAQMNLQAQMKKARRIRQAFVNLVAGAGFEPTTFGL